MFDRAATASIATEKYFGTNPRHLEAVKLGKKEMVLFLSEKSLHYCTVQNIADSFIFGPDKTITLPNMRNISETHSCIVAMDEKALVRSWNSFFVFNPEKERVEYYYESPCTLTYVGLEGRHLVICELDEDSVSSVVFLNGNTYLPLARVAVPNEVKFLKWHPNRWIVTFSNGKIATLEVDIPE